MWESSLFHFPSPCTTFNWGYWPTTDWNPLVQDWVNMSSKAPVISITTPSGTSPLFLSLIPVTKASAAFLLDSSISKEMNRSTLPPSGEVSRAMMGIPASFNFFTPGTIDFKSTAPAIIKPSTFCTMKLSINSMIFKESACPSLISTFTPNSLAFSWAPLIKA
ncbi:MAG: hypothetical protein BWY80_00944 [Firmicutes bacterium ADurb.Bin456]|nr:MAG: hypothetical protein BWY80_00944 [Firmicutes bacterium ADurb.Bin456]